jgi:CcmD family protein
MDDVPAEEQLPAAPLLAAAYIVVWVIAIGYLWTIWRRLGSVEKELADAMRRVDSDGA